MLNSVRYLCRIATLAVALAGCANMAAARELPDPYTEANVQEARNDCTNNNGYQCYFLGTVYEFGFGGTAVDYVQAASFYLKASELDNDDGFYGLGVLVGDGRGLTQDDARARRLIQRGCYGSGNGDMAAFACHDLGVMMSNGRGGPKDKAGAIKAFEDAAYVGDIYGQDSVVERANAALANINSLPSTYWGQ